MKPVSVEVITYAPTVFTHCQHCELVFGEVGIGERLRREEAAEALPDDLSRDSRLSPTGSTRSSTDTVAGYA